MALWIPTVLRNSESFHEIASGFRYESHVLCECLANRRTRSSLWPAVSGTKEGSGAPGRGNGDRQPHGQSSLAKEAVGCRCAERAGGLPCRRTHAGSDAVVDTLALPFGISPRNRALAEDGESGGVKYHNRAVLLVGANPAPSPCSIKFNPLRLPRIQAYSGPLGSDYWLKLFHDRPKLRYISDGDPATVSVPEDRRPENRSRETWKCEASDLLTKHARRRTGNPRQVRATFRAVRHSQ